MSYTASGCVGSTAMLSSASGGALASAVVQYISEADQLGAIAQ